MRHAQKEPLSKALRGRPFDHEEYMEILFPDVIGSGGAPKRIMKKRKGTDGASIAVDGTPNAGQSVMDLAMESSLYSQTPTHSSTQPPPPPPPQQQPQQQQQQQQPQQQQQQQPQPQQQAQPPPPPASAPSLTPTAHPTSVAIPSQNSSAVPAASALTPPDESPNATSSRKRFAPDSERRRGRPSRFSSNIYNTSPGAAATTPQPALPPSGGPPLRAQPLQGSFNTAGLLEDGLSLLAEALRARVPPKWPEQAMEILFRDFSDEDADLQLKIAEKALTDENKAMMFVKATPELRRHWVGRLREVHLRGLGLGRVGEEAS